jgi:hypothetical protein
LKNDIEIDPREIGDEDDPLVKLANERVTTWGVPILNIQALVMEIS